MNDSYASKRAEYKISDKLFLWYLGIPSRPIYVGELNFVSTMRGVSLTYGQEWLTGGFALSEDLPLVDIEHLPSRKDSAVGALDDARPDRWGEKVIKALEKPERSSTLEMLYFAGDDRFGALGVSTSATSYVPRAGALLPSFEDVEAVHEVVRKVMSGEPLEEKQKRLIAPGVTMGGARPKALIEMDGSQWVLKFAEEDHSFEPAYEHASMTLARKARINSAETKLVLLSKGCAVAVKRFDRSHIIGAAGVEVHPAHRKHAISANVALHAVGETLSYPSLAQLLRRRGAAKDDLGQAQMRELFRRLIFNILIDNTDDHEKNHAVTLNDANEFELSPAYDVLPTCLSLGTQAMEVGVDGSDSTIDNAISMSSAYGLSHGEAIEEAREVAIVVNDWASHFKASGVPEKWIKQVALSIDHRQLLAQRKLLIDSPHMVAVQYVPKKRKSKVGFV